MRSRTSVLALERNERDHRRSFSHATRTTFLRSLVFSLCSSAGSCGGSGAMTSSAAQRQMGGAAVEERERGRKKLLGLGLNGGKEERELLGENGGSKSDAAI